MCQIISVPAGKEVNMENLDKAQEHNQDGYGVAWYEDKTVKTYKTMNYDVFKKVLEALTPYTKIVHLRYNTVGETNLENCHPFEVPNGVMFHNGTINSLIPTGKWGNHKRKFIEPTTSDSKTLGDLLNECWYETVEDVKPLLKTIIGDKINKLAFLEDDGSVVIVNEHLGIEEDGIWYSNDYHLKTDGWCRGGYCTPKKETKYSFEKKEKKDETSPSKPEYTKVFVYGTLKRGCGNHHLLSKATFVAAAHTASKWAMVGKGRSFPYVVEPKDSGFNVKGEVYLVNQWQLAALDRLEGVSSNHYRKHQVTVKYSSGSNDFVTMYVACNKPRDYENMELIEEWKHETKSKV